MIQKSSFKPNWLLSNPHIQTIWQTIFRRQPELIIQRERLLLPDGDFVDLDWSTGMEGTPIVLILHGIAGSIQSPYAKGMLRAVVDNDWAGAVMHFRSCSGEPNRSTRLYHSGETGDLASVVEILKTRYPRRPIAVVGFSMGGNVLLKWLGETGENNPLAAAVAVSVPFELENAANHINKGFSKFYQWWMLKDLRALVARKFKKVKPPVEVNISDIHNFWDYDNKITAPLHGFADAHDYYDKSSIKKYLKEIRIPTLFLHSSDDPFMTKDTIAKAEELSPELTLELSDFGGHVGFIAGTPWKPKYWLEERIPQYLKEIFSK